MVYLEIETKYLVSPKHIRESDPVNTILGVTGREVYTLIYYLNKYFISYTILAIPGGIPDEELHS